MRCRVDKQKVILEMLICALMFYVFARLPVTKGPCFSEPLICGNEGSTLTARERKHSKQVGWIIQGE